MKKDERYKVKEKRPIIFRFFCSIARAFKRKPKTINLCNGPISENAIFLMSHCGASGPLAFELYSPVKATPWGAHEMCGNYRQRWNYLYHVFYRQKLHWGKVRSFIVATLFATISKRLYNSVGLIGTYTDGRLISTMRKSFDVLNAGKSILIFPENSNDGYYDKPPEFHSGFVALADLYYRKTKTDLPVYNVYYSKTKNRMVIDKPIYINKLLQEGKTYNEITNVFLNNCHELYDNYVACPAIKTHDDKRIAAVDLDICPIIRPLTTEKGA